jgi:hypothetical protein
VKFITIRPPSELLTNYGNYIHHTHVCKLISGKIGKKNQHSEYAVFLIMPANGPVDFRQSTDKFQRTIKQKKECPQKGHPY